MTSCEGATGPLYALCAVFCMVFAWSTLVVLAGLLIPRRRPPKASRRLRFAVLICARNEERVVRLPVKSILMSSYPADMREVVVLADNCVDSTARVAREAGATVWVKTEPSAGKGDVLAWGLDKVRESGRFDAVAVFDADNIVSKQWLDAMNDALCGGESVATGRRMASNARRNSIAGWYAVYWDLMNELSNRVRTKLLLSGKLTGTGFAFRLDVLGEKGWRTTTMTEDVEFSVQCNIAGRRIGYVPEAEYADEQPVTVRHMWRQLCRWATGCWQVARRYLLPWAREMLRNPSLRLFDSYFAILTGMSVAFIILIDFVALAVRLCRGDAVLPSVSLFAAILAFVAIMGGVTAWAAVALSYRKRRPTWLAVATFPVFSFVLSATVLWTLVRPTRSWKPIPHGPEAGK